MKRITDKEIAKALSERSRLTKSEKLYKALADKENAEEKLTGEVQLLNEVMDAPHGFYVKFETDKGSYIYHVQFENLTQSRVIWYNVYFYSGDNKGLPRLLTGQNGVYLKDFKKKWAFTKEELEDDKTRETLKLLEAEKKEALLEENYVRKSTIAEMSKKELLTFQKILKRNLKK